MIIEGSGYTFKDGKIVNVRKVFSNEEDVADVPRRSLESIIREIKAISEARRVEVVRLNEAIKRKEWLLREKIYDTLRYDKKVEAYDMKLKRLEKELSAAEKNQEIKTVIYEANLKRNNEEHAKDIEGLKLLIEEQKKEIINLRRYLRGITAIDYLKGNEKVAVYNGCSLIRCADSIIEELMVLSRLSPNRKCSFNYLEDGGNLRGVINNYDIIFFVHEGKSGHVIEEISYDCKAKVYCIDAREVQMGAPLVTIMREHKPHLRQTR